MTCAVNLGVVHVKTLGGKDANRIRIRLDTIVLVHGFLITSWELGTASRVSG